MRKYTKNGGQRRRYAADKQRYKYYQEIRMMNKTHEITKEEWSSCKEYFNNSCAYCGMREELHKEVYGQQLHREHVQHDGSNKIDNCIPACVPCNSSKSTKEFSQWYNSENENFNQDRYEKIITWLQIDHKLHISEEN